VWSELASTSVVTSQKNPVFDSVSIRLSKLRSDPAPESVDTEPALVTDELSIAGGTDYPLLVKAFHWKKRGEPEFMGSFETTLTELEQRAQGFVTVDPLASLSASAALAFRLIDHTLAADPKKGKDYKHSGLVYLSSMEVVLKDKDKRNSQRKSKRKTLTAPDGDLLSPSASSVSFSFPVSP
jgi:hypothetical protein